jgi:AraC family transcriptional activator of pobA
MTDIDDLTTSRLECYVHRVSAGCGVMTISSQRCYSIVFIQDSCMLKAGGQSLLLEDRSIVFLIPEQVVEVRHPRFSAVCLDFDENFVTLAAQNQYDAFRSTLFEPGGLPVVVKVGDQWNDFVQLSNYIDQECQGHRQSRTQVLAAYLKIIFIRAARLSVPLVKDVDLKTTNVPLLAQQLSQAIDKNYCHKHAPGQYADILNVTLRSLSRVSKRYWQKPLSVLINDRIMAHAKRELFLTTKPIKAIAWELGFKDEHYFSRFFKNNACISPRSFRDLAGQ